MLLPLIAYIGYVGGYFLTYCNRKEVENSKDNLILIQKVLFVFALWYFFFSLGMNLISVIIALISLSVFISKDKIPCLYVYPILGLMYLFDVTAAMSAVIFLFGIPSGTLDFGNWKMLLINLTFFIGSALIYFRIV